MFATYGSWVGHVVVFLVVFAALLVPGIVLVWRWSIGRVPVLQGVLFGTLAIVIPLQLLVGYSIAIRIASWMIRHRLITGTAVGVLVGAFCLGWFIAEKRELQTVETWFAKAAARVLGAAGGVFLTVVLIVGFTWARRYDDPVDVALAVPAIQLHVASYVALGDSYSAGEGLSPYQPGAGDEGDRCHRSDDAYSEKVHFVTALVKPVVFRACSGARSRQVFEFPQNKELGLEVTPGLLGPDTGLVTLTMGGNDVHFSGVLVFCANTVDCLDAPFNPGPPALDETDLVKEEPLKQWASDMLPVVQRRLESVFSEVRREAPNARIVVLGYPKLLPTGDVPRQFDSCDLLLRLIDRAEREGISALQERLNRIIYNATRAARIEFIDPASSFASHEACGVRGEMINDAKLSANLLNPVDAGAFHPRKEGQLMLARQLSCYLNQYTHVPDGTQEDPPGSPGNPIRC